jgi:hypothetical protein
MSLADVSRRLVALATFPSLIALLSPASTIAQEDRRQLIELDQQRLSEQHRTHTDINEPRALTSVRAAVSQLHSIVEADVISISFDYFDCEGPRTIVRLENVRSLLGGRTEPTLSLRNFGGYLPNGHYVYASELPRYVLGAHYILFLRNTDWKFSPVIGDLAFRVETIAGRQVLLDTDGVAVSDVSESGIHRQTPQLTEAVGLNVRGPVDRREIQPRDAEGDLTRCEVGRPCTGAEAGRSQERPADLIETGRFARPAVLAGLTADHVKAALSPAELVERIKRLTDADAVRFEGRLQLEPRIGCWNVTPTERPR